ncbi:glycosyltransferase 4 family protein [Nanoarchaeota archaeon]
MEPLLFVIFFISFIVTLVTLPPWIKNAYKEGLVGRDIHKTDKRKIAEGGGIAVLLGFTLGVLLYVALMTFYFGNGNIAILVFALLSVLFINSFVGVLDDLLGWKKGLSRKLRILIVILSAVPLMVINAGNSSMMGIELGLLYPLIVIPFGIVGATTTYNLLAGYNGLETGQGILLLAALAVVTYITGTVWLTVIALIMVASLIAFYIFNKYPAKVFPGDNLTYAVGALIAIIAILGNVEKIAIFFFIPYILETVLKIRGKLKKESFGKVNPDGSLEVPYGKFYGLEHIAIYLLKKIKPSRKVYEKEVTYLIHSFQIIIIILGFLLLL